MRSDAESIVIVVWVVLALMLAVWTIYDVFNGDVVRHLLVLAAGELVLAGLAKLALRLVRPRPR